MAIYIIGNPRSGIAVYMSYLISDMSINHLMIFIFASLIAVSISLVLCLKLGDSFSKLMGGVDYRKLSVAVIILQIGILYIFTLYYKARFLYGAGFNYINCSWNAASLYWSWKISSDGSFNNSSYCNLYANVYLDY